MTLLRWADPEADAGQLSSVFYEAVHATPSPYTAAERHAWLPLPPEHDAFAHRLSSKQVALAECDGRPAGFMALEKGGHIDLVFIREEYRGQGIFRKLYEMIETEARLRGEDRPWTYASLMAQAPFQAAAFLVIEHEVVEIAAARLRRAQMEKSLR